MKASIAAFLQTSNKEPTPLSEPRREWAADGFRAARIPANIPTISAPTWLVSIGSVAGMPRVIARVF
jgi:hypothetical protein